MDGLLWTVALSSVLTLNVNTILEYEYFQIKSKHITELLKYF